jgi:5'-nucleotidase
LNRGKLKIGLLGVGIELKGLVPENLFGNTKYNDPIVAANKVAFKLKKKEKCDLVICLSHLGYKYENSNKVSDQVLARETEHIDLIIGGHTHSFMQAPEKQLNKSGSEVVINQVGWGGIVLGRLDYDFSQVNKKNFLKSHTISVGKKTFN